MNHCMPPLSQVVAGVVFIGGLCAIPMVNRKTKPGHGMFDSERPQDISQAQERERKENLGMSELSGKAK
jgi:hypothetical protein